MLTVFNHFTVIEVLVYNPIWRPVKGISKQACRILGKCADSEFDTSDSEKKADKDAPTIAINPGARTHWVAMTELAVLLILMIAFVVGTSFVKSK